MSTRRIGLGPRPTRDAGAEAWVRGNGRTDGFTARLTVDVTPDLRSRIKVIAFQRGVTVAVMLRALLEREYGEGREAP
ncbi:chromosome partitioning protein ParB [Luteimonas kalidii]|uniref:Chromosome partitioning protein ParB n=1 Tax=Luteimonas kalidii TaxID=3042025 RepID=A0ABT6JXB3_9GAMM|nr:chromosome partitioning protein ParB [Luteimonas kalidii]MDH5835339.1 chromosome partitioning protein ParB [Luteimonas kalidii]